MVPLIKEARISTARRRRMMWTPVLVKTANSRGEDSNWEDSSFQVGVEGVREQISWTYPSMGTNVADSMSSIRACDTFDSSWILPGSRAEVNRTSLSEGFTGSWAAKKRPGWNNLEK